MLLGLGFRVPKSDLQPPNNNPGKDNAIIFQQAYFVVGGGEVFNTVVPCPQIRDSGPVCIIRATVSAPESGVTYSGLLEG